MKKHTHLAARIFNQPLLIDPRKLDAILTALGPRLELAPLVTEDDEYSDSEYSSPLTKSRQLAVTSNGVAVIPIHGTLVKRGSYLASPSGLVSYADIRAQLDQALSDRSCKSILLDVDSPGGEVAGLFDLAEQIYNARSIKPITAIANDTACSAGYALASCASQVLVTSISGVGSIGCLMLHCDQSVADQKAGLTFTYVFNGDKKIDGNVHQPLTSGARSDLQKEIDTIGNLFVETVARNRAVSAKLIRDTQAGTFMGEQAVPLLADAVATFDEGIQFAASDTQRARVRSERLRGSQTPTPAELYRAQQRRERLR
jgi:signal peptide peptidase SppA